MSAGDSPSLPLVRDQVADSTREVLNRGGWGNPDVLLVDAGERQVVVKDFAPRGRWVRRFLAPRLISREEEAYRRLAGVAAVPRLLGRLDRIALVFEYRPGTLLSRSLSGTLPSEFLGELEEAIQEMHRRGVVHLDLRHRSNILAGIDGRPVVIDFASALRFDVETVWGRMLTTLFGWIDRRALDKWRVRLV
jgi:serine/threonine protein kinase